MIYSQHFKFHHLAEEGPCLGRASAYTREGGLFTRSQPALRGRVGAYSKLKARFVSCLRCWGGVYGCCLGCSPCGLTCWLRLSRLCGFISQSLLHFCAHLAWIRRFFVRSSRKCRNHRGFGLRTIFLVLCISSISHFCAFLATWTSFADLCPMPSAHRILAIFWKYYTSDWKCHLVTFSKFCIWSATHFSASQTDFQAKRQR